MSSDASSATTPPAQPRLRGVVNQGQAATTEPPGGKGSGSSALPLHALHTCRLRALFSSCCTGPRTWSSSRAAPARPRQPWPSRCGRLHPACDDGGMGVLCAALTGRGRFASPHNATSTPHPNQHTCKAAFLLLPQWELILRLQISHSTPADRQRPASPKAVLQLHLRPNAPRTRRLSASSALELPRLRQAVASPHPCHMMVLPSLAASRPCQAPCYRSRGARSLYAAARSTTQKRRQHKLYLV